MFRSHEQTSPDASRPCAFCQLHVLPTRHSLQCAVCAQWQHRVCHRGNKSGVSHKEYLNILENHVIFFWQCVKCPQPGRQIDHVPFHDEDTVGDHINTVTYYNGTTCANIDMNNYKIDRTVLLEECALCADTSQEDIVGLNSSTAHRIDTNGTLLLGNFSKQNLSPCAQIDIGKQCTVGHSEYGEKTQINEQLLSSMREPFQELENSADGDKTLIYKSQLSSLKESYHELEKSEDGDKTLIYKSQFSSLKEVFHELESADGDKTFSYKSQLSSLKEIFHELEQSTDGDKTLIYKSQLSSMKELFHELEQSADGDNALIYKSQLSSLIELFHELQQSADGDTTLIFESQLSSLVKSFHELKQSVVGDKTLIYESQLSSLKEPLHELEHSEDGYKTLIFYPQLPFLKEPVIDSNMPIENDVEKTPNQSEISTVLFPSDASPLNRVSILLHNSETNVSPVPSVCSLGEQMSSRSTVGIGHLDSTAVLPHLSFSSVFFSTPITSTRVSRRQCPSLYRRVSAIPVYTPSPDGDFTFGSAYVTPSNNYLAPQNIKTPPTNIISPYIQVKCNKRPRTTVDEYSASKKRRHGTP